MDPSDRTRPRSPMIRIGLRRRRSTQAPAGRPNRMNGRNSAVPSSPTSKALASSSRIAISGNPNSVTWVPSWLIVSAVHSFRNAGWRHRLRGPGRNRRFEIGAAGEPSPPATGFAPFRFRPRLWRPGLLRPPLDGPGDRHERRVDSFGSFGRMLALPIRLEHLLDLLSDADQLVGSDPGVRLLERRGLAPHGLEPMLAGEEVADHPLVVLDPPPRQGAHRGEDLGTVLDLFGDAVAGGERPPPPLPSILGRDLFHEAELGEAPQVVTARGGALLRRLRTLRGGGGPEVLEVDQDGGAGGMRQRPHHFRVRELHVISERHVSKIYFQ